MESPSDSRACPTGARLTAFVLGELTAEDMDRIGAHVSACGACDQVVRRMSDPTCGPAGARPADPAPPAQLGAYRVGARLGRGGMGTVYRAEHVHLKKPVAVKVLFPNATRDPHAVARFQLEMEVIGRLDHPNIVRATDAGAAEGVHFLVMELIDGVTLSRLGHATGPLRADDACELVRRAALGLQHAHDHGLVHRDVKPGNLMLSRAGEVKVLDLGLALLRDPGARPAELTAAGTVLGTAEYMAPEQWDGGREVDGRADVYALGCTLYALLSGDPPFAGTYLQLMAAHQRDAVPPLAEERPELPADLCALVNRMLAKRPHERPASPGAVAAELARFARGADLPALAAAALGCGDSSAPASPARARTPNLRTETTRASGAAPRSGRARRAAAAVAALATVVGAAVAAVAVAGGSSAAPVPPGAEKLPRTKQKPEPNKWRGLLAEKPTERFWHPAPGAVLHHDADREALLVQSPRTVLVRLGTTSGPAQLQIGLRQMRWEGGAGVYFGGHAVGANFEFQYLTLKKAGAGPGREYALTRGRGRAVPGTDAPGVAMNGITSDPLPAPGPEEYLLELALRPEGLDAVRWGGTSCPAVVGARATEATAALPLDGEFGIICNGASVTVTTARVLGSE